MVLRLSSEPSHSLAASCLFAVSIRSKRHEVEENIDKNKKLVCTSILLRMHSKDSVHSIQ